MRRLRRRDDGTLPKVSDLRRKLYHKPRWLGDGAHVSNDNQQLQRKGPPRRHLLLALSNFVQSHVRTDASGRRIWCSVESASCFGNPAL